MKDFHRTLPSADDLDVIERKIEEDRFHRFDFAARRAFLRRLICRWLILPLSLRRLSIGRFRILSRM